MSVPVTVNDAPNTPHFHQLQAYRGRTYRVRVWPDLNADIRGMLLIVADPSGTPVRREVSQ
eukprot:COSAG01_NODE_12163_length_1789_cov_1.856805_2_plen_60_part_01